MNMCGMLSTVLAQSRCLGGLACVWQWLTLASTLADPGWASISRGVLVCDECCSVHRSLGRHISIVKHLRHSAWPPTLLQVWMLAGRFSFSTKCAERRHISLILTYTPAWVQQLPGGSTHLGQSLTLTLSTHPLV